MDTIIRLTQKEYAALYNIAQVAEQFLKVSDDRKEFWTDALKGTVEEFNKIK